MGDNLENKEIDFRKIIDDIASIMGVPNPQTPNDIAEFLMASENREDTVYLYDLLKYLFTDQRSNIHTAIALDIPYLAELAGREIKDNKQRALARFECNLLGCNNFSILHWFEHREFVNGKYYLTKPTILINRNIDDYNRNSEDKLVNYVIGLFDNKNIRKSNWALDMLEQGKPRQEDRQK